jgi:hypothetical protein
MVSNSGVLFSVPATRPFSTMMVIGVAGRLTRKLVSPNTKMRTAAHRFQVLRFGEHFAQRNWPPTLFMPL